MTLDDTTPFSDPGFRLDLATRHLLEFNLFILELLSCDWCSADSPLRLRDDLSLDQVGSTRFFDQARRFLRLMVENDGAPLTPGGWLKRAYVARLLEHLEWPRGFIAPLRSCFRKIDESDVKPLKIINSVCQLGNLVRKRRGRLYVPRTVLPLLEDDRAGQLYHRLFLTFFRKFNLDNLWGFAQTPLLQDTIAILLWRLTIVAREWVPLHRIPDELLLGPVWNEIIAQEEKFQLDLLFHRVLEPLAWFGLLECTPELREIEFDITKDLRDLRLRKRPLFDQFIQFQPFSSLPIEAS
ncbi:MAG: hypothetical protein ABIK44_08125 [candidate division WOR-3 bacterium]